MRQELEAQLCRTFCKPNEEFGFHSEQDGNIEGLRTKNNRHCYYCILYFYYMLISKIMPDT